MEAFLISRKANVQKRDALHDWTVSAEGKKTEKGSRIEWGKNENALFSKAYLQTNVEITYPADESIHRTYTERASRIILRFWRGVANPGFKSSAVTQHWNKKSYTLRAVQLVWSPTFFYETTVTVRYRILLRGCLCRMELRSAMQRIRR